MDTTRTIEMTPSVAFTELARRVSFSKVARESKTAYQTVARMAAEGGQIGDRKNVRRRIAEALVPLAEEHQARLLKEATEMEAQIEILKAWQAEELN